MYWNLTNKKAVITGGTKGIGLATLNEFLDFGAEILFVARGKDDVIQIQKEKEQQYPGKVHGLQADVSTIEGRDAIISFVKDKWGSLDILVNNVGSNIRKPTLDANLEDLRKIMQTNFEPAYELSKAFHPLLKESKSASIINVSSIASKRIISTSTAIYAMSKGAMDEMTDFFAVEWGKEGIRVNSVHPWYINTPLAEQVMKDKEKRTKIVNATPLGRVGEPEEVARAIAFLAMPASSYISGIHLEIDGAFSKVGF